MLDVRIDTKIFTTNSTYHCEMHFGTTVAYRRVNLRCSTFASEVLHAVKIVVCFSPKETTLICPHENCNTANTPIGHTNVYSSYGWLILARVMVLYVPNGYGSFLCLVYATSHLLFGGFCSYLV
jgi:hypothetical protein